MFLVVHGDAAMLTVEQQLHARESPLHLAHLGHRPNGVQQLGRHVLDVVPLGHGENKFVVAREGRFDSAQRAGTSRPDRGGYGREQHHFAKRQDGYGHAFRHMASSLLITRYQARPFRARGFVYGVCTRYATAPLMGESGPLAPERPLFRGLEGRSLAPHGDSGAGGFCQYGASHWQGQGQICRYTRSRRVIGGPIVAPRAFSTQIRGLPEQVTATGHSKADNE